MKAIVVALALLSAGCSSAVDFETAKHAPALDAAFADPSRGTSAIRLTRDGGIWGATCTFHFGIDGVDAAAIGPGETFLAYVQPGQHKISAAAPSIMCGDVLYYLDVTTRAGFAENIRLGGSISQSVELRIETPSHL